MATVELVLALLAAVTLGGAIVKWTPFPLPILLVVVGAAMSFVSGFDAIRILAAAFGKDRIYIVGGLRRGDGMHEAAQAG